MFGNIFKARPTQPPGNIGIPYVGEAVEFTKNPMQFIIERSTTHGPVFKTRIYGEVLTRDKIYKILVFFVTDANMYTWNLI